MTKADHQRGRAFTVVLSLLLLLSTLHIADRILLFVQDKPEMRGLRGLYFVDVLISVGFVVLVLAALRWKMWGMYGLIGLGLASGVFYFYVVADYVIADGTVYALKSGLALLAVLLSLLNKDWATMR